MKGLHAFIIIVVMVGLFGCDEHITMKIYGDSPMLDEALNELSVKYDLLGNSIVIASKYEKPDIVIVNGLEALDKVKKLYDTDLLSPDTLSWNIQERIIKNTSMLFIVGKNTNSTKMGINTLTLRIDDVKILRDE